MTQSLGDLHNCAKAYILIHQKAFKYYITVFSRPECTLYNPIISNMSHYKNQIPCCHIYLFMQVVVVVIFIFNTQISTTNKTRNIKTSRGIV